MTRRLRKPGPATSRALDLGQRLDRALGELLGDARAASARARGRAAARRSSRSRRGRVLAAARAPPRCPRAPPSAASRRPRALGANVPAAGSLDHASAPPSAVLASPACAPITARRRPRWPRRRSLPRGPVPAGRSPQRPPAAPSCASARTGELPSRFPAPPACGGASVSARSGSLMRVAVVSDIHGNYHALEAVLAEVDGGGARRALVPRRHRRLRARAEPLLRAGRASDAALCLAGNHDLAVIGALPVDDFNGDAADAVRWTQGVLVDGGAALPRRACPRRRRARASSSSTAARSTRSGTTSSARHAARLSLEATHGAARARRPQPRRARRSATTAAPSRAGSRTPATRSTSRPRAGSLNPGSVGQPRGGDPRAAWLLLDLDAGRAASAAPTYPLERTQAEIRAAGLPEALAAPPGPRAL